VSANLKQDPKGTVEHSMVGGRPKPVRSAQPRRVRARRAWSKLDCLNPNLQWPYRCAVVVSRFTKTTPGRKQLPRLWLQMTQDEAVPGQSVSRHPWDNQGYEVNRGPTHVVSPQIQQSWDGLSWFLTTPIRPQSRRNTQKPACNRSDSPRCGMTQVISVEVTHVKHQWSGEGRQFLGHFHNLQAGSADAIR
jgi:hypothetical protein